jgi:hypothetical protein
VFAVDGVGVWMQSANLVASGSWTSGNITFDIVEAKTALEVDTSHLEPMMGSHQVFFSTDGAPDISLGERAEGKPEVPFPIPQQRGKMFVVTHVMNRLSTDATQGPTCCHTTLKALPAVSAGVRMSPVLVMSPMIDVFDKKFAMDVAGELAFLKALRLSQQIVTYQEGTNFYPVIVEDIDWQPEQLSPDKKYLIGALMVTLRTLDG